MRLEEQKQCPYARRIVRISTNGLRGGWFALLCLLMVLGGMVQVRAQGTFGPWKHLSSTAGDLPVPNGGDQQTSTAVLDADGDGVNDFLITDRSQAPSVVMYRRVENGWDKYIVEDEHLRIEAGSAVHDIDGDGDRDVVFAGDAQSNEVWWWENPAPEFDQDQPWERHLIAATPGTKHHDQLFGDFDGDGAQELTFWNQGAQTLYIADIPENPRSSGEWPMAPVYRYSEDSQMDQRGSYPSWRGTNEHEGLYPSDIDGDGVTDIVAGGRWFKHVDGHNYRENIIDAAYPFSRAAAGDLIEGGRPEVVLVVGDGAGPLVMYEYREGTWVDSTLIHHVRDGHSLDIVDVNGDGHLDIFAAEMRLGQNPDAKTWILTGDGQGGFSRTVVAQGYGLHEAKINDLDGDGDYDILGKPYTWEAPRVDIWLNDTD